MEQGVGGTHVPNEIDDFLRDKRLALLEDEQSDDAILGDLVKFTTWMRDKRYPHMDIAPREVVSQYVREVTNG